ncbi:hypothetical protein VTK56DRAFT_1461 [Thermocarpiscus australiensis]
MPAMNNETYYGIVRTPVDAIKLFEACRLGLLPRVQRRLSEKERQAIRSGSVFVWDEREAGMRRWTDGKSWSASRVSGSFLTYREMEGKRGNAFGSSRRAAGRTPDSSRGSDEDHDDGGPDGYRYKPDGLLKQSFSITTSTGQHLHLISYYARGSPDLPQPSTDPALRNIVPAKGLYPESSLSDTPVPALTRSPMQQPPPPYPPHHQGYPPHYPHPAYSWPPSPMATPPYSHGHYPYSYGPPPPLPPPQPYHHYPPAHPPLPPPPPALPPPTQLPGPASPRHGLPLPYPYPQGQQQPSPHEPQTGTALLHPAWTQQLQAQAREAVTMEPHVTGNHNPPGLLPEPSQPAQQRGPLNNHTSPPPPPPLPRARSASPPRSAVSDGGGKNGHSPIRPPTASNSNKASLATLLLHPISAAGSDTGSATSPSSNSVSGSPRAALPAGQDEDARTIGVLNKNLSL